MATRRIAFREVVYFDELTEFANGQAWHAATPDGEPVPSTLPEEVDSWHFVWTSPSGVRIEFVDDEVVECQFLRIHGDATGGVERAVRQAFPVLDAVEAAREYNEQRSLDQRERLLRIIAATVPDTEDEDVAATIMTGLHDEWDIVRLVAMIAAGSAGWARFRERLQVLRDRESDPNLRTIAKNKLAALTDRGRESDD